MLVNNEGKEAKIEWHCGITHERGCCDKPGRPVCFCVVEGFITQQFVIINFIIMKNVFEREETSPAHPQSARQIAELRQAEGF